MGLKIAAACLIGATSITIGIVPVLAKKAPVAKRTTAAKRAAAAKAPVAPLSPEDAFLAKNRKLRGVIQTASGVQYRVIKPATGAHPTDKDVVLVNYEGKLIDGTSFDKSTQPTPMPVAGVVPGFSEALKLMAKGETLRVWIPSRLAYGPEDQRDEQGKVVIPGSRLWCSTSNSWTSSRNPDPDGKAILRAGQAELSPILCRTQAGLRIAHLHCTRSGRIGGGQGGGDDCR